jgi:hypothetical protein
MDSTYTLELRFTPSFHRPSVWLATCRGGREELLVEVSGFRGGPGFSMITEILGAASGRIYGVAEKVIPNAINWPRRRGLDGAGTTGSYESPKRGALEFSFWSPREGDEPHELVAVLFDAVSSNHSDDKWNDYFEQLRSYFDCGVPVRILDGSPHVLRISCRLSLGMEDELRNIFARAAALPELIIDMRNFEGMGTMLVPEFAPLIARKAPAKWLASEEALAYLRMMRVPEEIIEKPAATTRCPWNAD